MSDCDSDIDDTDGIVNTILPQFSITNCNQFRRKVRNNWPTFDQSNQFVETWQSDDGNRCEMWIELLNSLLKKYSFPELTTPNVLFPPGTNSDSFEQILSYFLNVDNSLDNSKSAMQLFLTESKVKNDVSKVFDDRGLLKNNNLDDIYNAFVEWIMDQFNDLGVCHYCITELMQGKMSWAGTNFYSDFLQYIDNLYYTE